MNFLGSYRLCQQYVVGDACKIGEAQCSFAHYPEEMNLWRLDREEQIDMNKFIVDQRNNILKGSGNRRIGNVSLLFNVVWIVYRES